MTRNAVETVMGAVVLLVAGLFLFFAYSTTDAGRVSGYALTAHFDRVGALKVGSDVRLSGVKVGSVVGQDLDPNTYLAVVTFTVRSGLQLPQDTSAEIVSEGLLGNQYLALVPGGAPDMLRPGDQLEFTQSAISLEQLLGKFIFSNSGADEQKPAP